MATKYFKKVADGGIQMPTAKTYNNMTVNDDLAVGGDATITGNLTVNGKIVNNNTELSLGSANVGADGAQLIATGNADARIYPVGLDFSAYNTGDVVAQGTGYFYLPINTSTSSTAVLVGGSDTYPTLSQTTIDAIVSETVDSGWGWFNTNNTIFAYGTEAIDAYDLFENSAEALITKVKTVSGKNYVLIASYVDEDGSSQHKLFDETTKTWVDISTVTPDETKIPLFSGSNGVFQNRSGTVSTTLKNPSFVSFDNWVGTDTGDEAKFVYEDSAAHVYLPKDSAILTELSTDISKITTYFPMVALYNSTSELPTPTSTSVDNYAIVKNGTTIELYGWIPSSNSWEAQSAMFTTSDTYVHCKLTTEEFDITTPKFKTFTVPELTKTTAGDYVFTATVSSEGAISYAWKVQS